MLFLTEDEELISQIHWSIKISVRSWTLLTFAIGWAVCGRPQPGHESMMPVLSTRTLSCVRKHLKKALCFIIFFIYLRAFTYWSSVVNSILITSLLTKEYLTERPVIFICVNSAFPQLYCLKFSFKLARSYEVWLLFSTQCIYNDILCSRLFGKVYYEMWWEWFLHCVSAL